MSKIAVFLPKSDLTEPILHLLTLTSEPGTLIEVVDHDSIREITENAIENSVSVIISKGCYGLDIKNMFSIPVVDVMLTVKEMENLIRRARLMSDSLKPVIAIIDFSTASYYLPGLEQTLGVRLLHYNVKSQVEIGAVVIQAREAGAEVIIGGGIATEHATALGLPCLSLTASEDSIREALRVASAIKDALSVQTEQIAQLETLLDYSFNAIIKINNQGEILLCNHIASTSLAAKINHISGRPLQDFIDGLTPAMLANVLVKGQKIYSTIFSIKNKKIIGNIAPIIAGGTIKGAIFSWHEIRQLERMETTIRRELYPLGYVAEHHFSDLKGASDILQKKVATASQYSLSAAPVLISGTTGTEKEILAQCIHNESPRRKEPFIAIDPASQLDENQAAFLFGYNEDTLTESPALKSKRNGILFQAHGGTAYFREVAALTMQSQQLLLRLLQNHVLAYTGNEKPLPVDIRIIASTKRNLPLLVEQGKFNKALYYRLNTLFINLPPLSTRPADVLFWSRQYIKKYTTIYHKYISLTAGATEILQQYPWEGNLIQLESFCEQLVITTTHQRINEHIITQLLNEMYPDNPLCDEDSKPAHFIMTPEQQQIEAALSKYHGNRSQAAKALGISTSTLWRRMKKYDLSKN